MKCHGLDIKKDWLEIKNGDEQLQLQYLEDAFQMLILQDEKDNANPLKKQEITAKLENLSKVGLSKSKVLNSIMQIKNDLIVGPDEQNKEFSLYKKGGTFGGIEVRPCRAQPNTFGQIKSKGSQDFLDKKQENPNQILIQTRKNATQLYPWDSIQSVECRLFLTFPSRSPIWVYIGDLSEAKRWWSYFKCSRAIQKCEEITNQMQGIAQDYQHSLVEMFCDYLHREARYIVKQRKRAAKLTRVELQFLVQCEQAIASTVIEKWKTRARSNVNREIQLLKEKEDDEKQKLKEQELKQKLQDTINNNLKFLNVKVMQISPNEPLSKMMQKWMNRAEQNYNIESVKSMEFVLTFRSLHIDENIEMVKPILEIALQNKQMAEQQNKKNKSKQPDIYYKLKIFGKLNTKARNQYYRWDLFESQFENYTGVQKQTPHVLRESCSIRIANLMPDDVLTLSLVDGVAVFEEATSEFQTLNVSDFFENTHQGRSVWLPITLVTKVTDLGQGGEHEVVSNASQQNESTKRTIVFVEIDLLSLPSEVCKEAISYEDELEQIIHNGHPICDPIYQNTIKLPQINNEVIQVLIKIIEENYGYMKNSMKMISYMMLVGTHESEIEIINNNYFELKKLIFRKIIENVCHIMGSLPIQIALWDKVFIHLINYGKQLKKDNDKVNPMRLFVKKIQTGIDDKMASDLRNAALAGYANHMRQAVWFSMLNGFKAADQLAEILRNSFCIFQEQRQLEGIGLSEYVWLYYKLALETAALQSTLAKEVFRFIKQETQRGNIIGESQQRQFERILLSFLLYQQCLGVQMNNSFLQYLFLVALKLQSMSNYHYVKFRPRWKLIDDGTDEIGLGDLSQFQKDDLENQARSFYLLCGIFENILQAYPYMNSQTHKGLLDDCSYLTCYLIKCEKNLYDMMQIYNVRAENIFSELFLTLFSDIFASEQLFRLWDLLIFECIRMPPGERPYIIPGVAATIINRLKSKTYFIFSQYDFIQAFRFEAALISEFEVFLKEVQDCTIKLAQSVNQVMDEDGFLPSNAEVYNETYREKNIRFFDMFKHEVPQPPIYQQLPINQYMEADEID